MSDTANHERTINGAPDDTGDKQKATQFKPGQSGNPKGRPIGARSRVSEAFLSDLAESWEMHGRQALIACAISEPAQYVKIVASLLPRQVDVSGDITIEIEQTLTAYRTLLGVEDKRLIEHDG